MSTFLALRPDQPLDVSLQPDYVIAGELEGPGADRDVLVYAYGIGGEGGGHAFRSLATRGRDEVRGVQPGTYQLLVHGNGIGNAEAEFVTAGVERVARHDLRIERRPSVRGILSQDGAPGRGECPH